MSLNRYVLLYVDNSVKKYVTFCVWQFCLERLSINIENFMTVSRATKSRNTEHRKTHIRNETCSNSEWYTLYCNHEAVKMIFDCFVFYQLLHYVVFFLSFCSIYDDFDLRAKVENSFAFLLLFNLFSQFWTTDLWYWFKLILKVPNINMTF